MKAKELNYATLRYCGKDFNHYTYNGNPVYKLHFVDEQFTYYEFYTVPGYNADAFFSAIKNGSFVTIGWCRYGDTWKKIAKTYELAKMEGVENE